MMDDVSRIHMNALYYVVLLRLETTYIWRSWRMSCCSCASLALSSWRLASTLPNKVSMCSFGQITTPSSSAMTRSPSWTTTPPIEIEPPNTTGPYLFDAAGVTPRHHTLNCFNCRISTASRNRPSVTSATIPASCISKAINPQMVAVREVLPPATTRIDPGRGEARIASRTDRLSSRLMRTTKAGPTARASGLREPIHEVRTPCPSFASDASCEASTRTGRADRLASFARKLISVRQAAIDLLALRDQIALILDVEHG